MSRAVAAIVVAIAVESNTLPTLYVVSFVVSIVLAFALVLSLPRSES